MSTTENCIKESFYEYGNVYKKILSIIYPAKNSSGFAERNLSVNYTKSYEKVARHYGQDTFTWYEFQFGKNNNLHVDAVIFNVTAKTMIVIESKRFSNPITKMREIGKDIDRIIAFIKELNGEINEGTTRVNLDEYNKIYGMVLADVWEETELKVAIKESFVKGMENHCSNEAFMNRYRDKVKHSSVISDIYYDVQSMNNEESAKNYSLVSFWWRIRGGVNDDMS